MHHASMLRLSILYHQLTCFVAIKHFTVPTAPRLLTVVRNTSTSVDLNWIPPRHPNGVIHYEIEYSTNKSFVDSTTINIASNITYYTVSDVLEFPRHYLRVVAVNSAGVGRSSSSNAVEVCLGREVGKHQMCYVCQ